jgi:hypothetical protein
MKLTPTWERSELIKISITDLSSSSASLPFL